MNTARWLSGWRFARAQVGIRTIGVLVAVALLMVGCDHEETPPVVEETPPVVVIPPHDFGDNNPALYVAMGDSITWGVDATPYPVHLASLLAQTVINDGVSGEHAYEAAARVDALLAHYKPGFLLILYGANDLLHAGHADAIAEDLRFIVQAAKNAKTIPILATLTPMARSHGVFDSGTKSINAFIRQMALEEDVLLVDLETVFGDFDNDEDPYVLDADDLLLWDGLHPNEAGSWEIALAFEAVIRASAPTALSVR
jgi:lysophospholipase L1-like esterase